MYPAGNYLYHAKKYLVCAENYTVHAEIIAGFCQEKTRTYQTTTLGSHNFVSPKTWVKAFFAWVASHAIDFWKEVDPWCKHDPKVLACDGTHIGVSVRQLALDPPLQLQTKMTQCNNCTTGTYIVGTLCMYIPL